ncbi:MAG: sugar ABC transporter substrate-binding protein, partial [Lachnospiraceae bacterium]|nr:sugar ABC transporter substrate-binding protein [Lachnospiraceae bacterium]
MKKKLVSMLLVAGMAISLLAGCGGSTSGTEQEGDATGDDAIENLIAATEGPVELTLWCAETKEYQTVMKKLVADFETTYPEIDFNITIGAESEANCKDDVLADVESAADVFVFPDDQLLDLVTAGALQSV